VRDLINRAQASSASSGSSSSTTSPSTSSASSSLPDLSGLRELSWKEKAHAQMLLVGA
jgi:hypothetical protein